MKTRAKTERTPQSREFEGKTVEQATAEACEFFHTEEDALEIEVITRGSTGLFGLGGRKARIKACLKKAEEGAAEAPQPAAEAPATKPAARQASPKPKPRSRQAQPPPQKTEPAPEPAPAQEADTDDDTHGVKAPVSPELLETARGTVQSILEKAHLEGLVTMKESEDGPCLDLSGEDLSLIIGRDGQTLDALEYLVNRIVRQGVPESEQIVLDAQGYRQRKEDGLARLAQKTAQKVQRSGRSVALPPMDARDRRIIHLTLKKIRGVETHSSGEGAMRRVVISRARRGRRGTSQQEANTD